MPSRLRHQQQWGQGPGMEVISRQQPRGSTSNRHSLLAQHKEHITGKLCAQVPGQGFKPQQQSALASRQQAAALSTAAVAG